MRIGDICKRHVITTAATTPVTQVAKLMREAHVGCVVVIDTASRPVGMLTDRDIVVEIVAAGMEAASVRAGDVMTAHPTVADPADEASWALKVMRDRGVRRLPVVNAAGTLIGIIALDDLLESAAVGLSDLVQAIGTERLNEGQRRKAVA